MPDRIISQDILITHEKAKILFEPFVPADTRVGFNTAWENYKNTKDIYSDDPKAITNNRDYPPAISNLYLDNLNYLLDEFAQPK